MHRNSVCMMAMVGYMVNIYLLHRLNVCQIQPNWPQNPMEFYDNLLGFGIQSRFTTYAVN